MKDKVAAYTREQVDAMRSDQLKAVLEEFGFPTLSKKEERLEAVNILLFETDEEKMKIFSEKYGSTHMWRLGFLGSQNIEMPHMQPGRECTQDSQGPCLPKKP